jgi:hypothetical protein
MPTPFTLKIKKAMNKSGCMPPHPLWRKSLFEDHLALLLMPERD